MPPSAVSSPAADPAAADSELPAAHASEHRLIARALEGDGRAFADLVTPHLDMMYRLAARAIGRTDLAEDAVQEALALAHLKLDRYEPGSSLRAFLAAFAVNQAQSLSRSERRRRARELQSLGAGVAPDAEQLLSAQQAWQRVQAALDGLPKKRRKVVTLRLDTDFTYAEIAQAVGTSEGSARVLVHLAMRQLRALLDRLLCFPE